jgi:hypothetical protein
MNSDLDLHTWDVQAAEQVEKTRLSWDLISHRRTDIVMELYFVDGIRHSAVVLANGEKQAVELATKAHSGVKIDAVLFGSVGEWEVPSAHELKLPKGYRIVQARGRRHLFRPSM